MSGISVHGGLVPLKMKLLTKSGVFVVCDENVLDFAEKVASGRPLYPLRADEEHKTMEAVLGICRWLLDKGAGRDALLLAVGGGVTSDIAGFAACIYKRGIRYANVPTTLLSMVDAGIGGKTGVNLDSFKNMLGIIRQPEFTYICSTVLKTLPERELRSGAAEMLKTFIICNDGGNYEKAVKLLAEPFNPEKISPLIQAAAKIKSRIVEKDEFETGLRRTLNLGHTYGHAIEWWQHSRGAENPYSHGEAVAIGIVEAARLSEDLGVAKPGLAARLAADFSYCGLPVQMPCGKEVLDEALHQDKKTEGGKINFVLIKEIGKVTVKKI